MIKFILSSSWIFCILQQFIVYTLAAVPCDIGRLYQCSKKPLEVCKKISEDKGECQCIPNYERDDSGECVARPKSPIIDVLPNVPSSESFAGLLWIFIPCLILGAFGALVFLGKRYGLTERLYALRVRRYNTVFVSSANVDDDAPIT